MIARTDNLVKNEDEVTYCVGVDKKRLEQLLGQFNILLEEYSDALSEENILNKYKTLMAYGKKRKNFK